MRDEWATTQPLPAFKYNLLYKLCVNCFREIDKDFSVGRKTLALSVDGHEAAAPSELLLQGINTRKDFVVCLINFEDNAA